MTLFMCASHREKKGISCIRTHAVRALDTPFACPMLYNKKTPYSLDISYYRVVHDRAQFPEPLHHSFIGYVVCAILLEHYRP